MQHYAGHLYWTFNHLCSHPLCKWYSWRDSRQLCHLGPFVVVRQYIKHVFFSDTALFQRSNALRIRTLKAEATLLTEAVVNKIQLKRPGSSFKRFAASSRHALVRYTNLGLQWLLSAWPWFIAWFANHYNNWFVCRSNFPDETTPLSFASYPGTI